MELRSSALFGLIASKSLKDTIQLKILDLMQVPRNILFHVTARGFL